ncbi:hypothetical protein FB451DRAFT_1282765, partial [Mycena latifolia]
MHAMIPGPFQPELNLTSWSSLVLYSTNSVLDSDGNTGFPLALSPPMGPNSTVFALQFLQCSQSLVVQSGEVDPESGLILPASLTPNIHKSSSRWDTYTAPKSTNTSSSPLENGEWPIPPSADSSVPMSLSSDDFSTFSWMDLYLMEKLKLGPSWLHPGVESGPPTVLYLHDIENALSNLLASYFWIAGHIHQRRLVTKYSVSDDGTAAAGTAPVLSVGSTEVSLVEPATRLNLNIIPVSLGLGASIVASLLAIQFVLRSGARGTPLTGMGILHGIWLFRNHPRLEDELENATKPTDRELRAAGMVRVQFLGESGNRSSEGDFTAELMLLDRGRRRQDGAFGGDS